MSKPPSPPPETASPPPATSPDAAATANQGLLLDTTRDAQQPVVAGLLAQALATPDPLPRKLGRYTLLQRIGEGGMGWVYKAHDPQLDRAMAVKILRVDGDPAVHATRQLRLLREAQALARLSHPNVVTVHDAGMEGQQVYVAMEYVVGTTLDGWLRNGTHSFAQVMDVLLQAGAGLAAAHSRGVVHRDFKPANVLVGQDGRVRVGDFGLARVEGPRPSSDRAVAGVAWPAEMPLTEEGLVMGTPAYMAPEQRVGDVVGPPADQYSFCVTVFEALFAQRPTVAQAVMGGQPVPVPDLRPVEDVPTWIKPVLARGLQASPDARYPTMSSLLAALTHPPEAGAPAGAMDPQPRSTRRRALGAAGVGLGVAVLGGLAWWVTGPTASPKLPEPLAAAAVAAAPVSGGPPQAQACVQSAGRLGNTWNRTAAAQLLDAPGLQGDPTRAALARTVVDRLDAWARDWASQHDAACTAAAAGDVAAQKNLDCLQQHLMRIQTLLGDVAAQSPGQLTATLQAAAAWPAQASCAALNDAVVSTGARPAPVDVPQPAASPARPAPAKTRGRPPTGQGTVTLQSAPWARIAVDGKDTGLYTPQNHLPLSAGRHQVTFTNEALGKSTTFYVTIKPGVHLQAPPVTLR